MDPEVRKTQRCSNGYPNLPYDSNSYEHRYKGMATRIQEHYGRIDQTYFADQLRRVIDDAPALDALIGQFAARGVEQLDAIGRAVLLLALAELKFRADIPHKVVINEAVKLAKRYGAADSYRFVNAVADKAGATLRGRAPAGA